ncbi:hypothetical protein D3C80_1085060 [compost metagenome]
MGLDGDLGIAGVTRRDHQWLLAVLAVALEVGKGVIELVAGGGCGQFFAQARGNQPATIKHQAVFKLFGFFHVGRGHQQGQLRSLLAYLFDQLPEAPARQRVDAGGGFVENQQVRFVDQRTAQPELLLHAARQLARRALGKAQQVGGQQQVVHALFALLGAKAEQGGEEADVFADRKLRVKVIAQALGHEGDARVQVVAMAALADRAAEHLQLAALQFLDPGDQPEQARLAGAVRADEAAAGASRQAEGDVLQGTQPTVAVVDALGVQRQRAHCRLAGQSTSAVRT